MRTHATPPSILSSNLWMLSRKEIAIVTRGLYPVPIRGSSLGEEGPREVGRRNVDQPRLARRGTDHEANLVPALLLVDGEAGQVAGVEATRAGGGEPEPPEQRPRPS